MLLENGKGEKKLWGFFLETKQWNFTVIPNDFLLLNVMLVTSPWNVTVAEKIPNQQIISRIDNHIKSIYIYIDGIWQMSLSRSTYRNVLKSLSINLFRYCVIRSQAKC